MVFTISSNEHTLKTVLNSKMASNTSITYMPKFQLSSTINTPHNMVSMVCLESCIITPPSMFTSPVLDDDTNKFDRYILNAGGVVVGNPQAYWSTFNLNPTLDRAGGTTFATQTNLVTINSLFSAAEYLDLSSMEQLVQFLYTLVLKSRCLTLTFPSLPGDTVVADECKMSWVSTPLANPNVGTVTAPAELFNDGGQAWGTQGTHAAFTQDMLVTRLKKMTHVTFQLGCNANMNVGGNTTEFRLAGKWLKIFNLNPSMNDTTQTDKYISFSSAVLSTDLCIQTGGYTGLSVHSSFAKSIYSSGGGTNNLSLAPTNILWPIQIISNPWSPTYFTNMNTAGKVSYFMPCLEEIEIYFTDTWGDLITDAIDFQIVLTFDFALPDPFPEPETIKRARARLHL